MPSLSSTAARHFILYISTFFKDVVSSQASWDLLCCLSSLCKAEVSQMICSRYVGHETNIFLGSQADSSALPHSLRNLDGTCQVFLRSVWCASIFVASSEIINQLSAVTFLPVPAIGWHIFCTCCKEYHGISSHLENTRAPTNIKYIYIYIPCLCYKGSASKWHIALLALCVTQVFYLACSSTLNMEATCFSQKNSS
jgi:hypothetical protein